VFLKKDAKTFEALEALETSFEALCTNFLSRLSKRNASISLHSLLENLALKILFSTLDFV